MKTPLNKPWQAKWLDMDVTHPSIQKMADAVMMFARDWFNCSEVAPKLLVIAGPSGTGKTHAMEKLERWARHSAFYAWECSHWPKPPAIWKSDWAPIVDEIDSTMQSIASMVTLTEADLLFLDDVGADTDRFKTGKPTDALGQLLNLRKRSWTVITTNIHPTEWATRWDVRVADRLHRNSRIVDLGEAKSFAMIPK